MSTPQKTAIIIGAGPAGLTAAYELREKTDIKPVIFEFSEHIGGIARTVNFKGNFIDIGGHRFFSKSDRVMKWWTDMMPVEGHHEADVEITYQNQHTRLGTTGEGPDPARTDLVMLIRSRLSRIFYLRSFFRYPVSLSLDTILNLGVVRMVKIMCSYLRARVFPIRDERTLEDFMINRFGRELYRTFFRDYTEKVWGTPCANIPAEWGAQRIKGLSITRAIAHALRSLVKKKDSSIGQKGTETTLIEQFIYPKFGPGQMWQETARKVVERGGALHLRCRIDGLQVEDGRVTGVNYVNLNTGEKGNCTGDYFFSTMPVKELIAGISGDAVPEEVQEVARGLVYRDFLIVGLLLKKLHVRTKRGRKVQERLPDNWIYIQEAEVKIGRIQIFNNWSPYMVKDPDTVWLGLEYFCNEGDDLWVMDDSSLAGFAADELETIDFIQKEDVLDSIVIRMPKTYPAYFGTYDRFHLVQEFTDRIENLFLIGRNGMHRYNNSDHSMLTAMMAVDNIANGVTDKSNIWNVNIDDDYHEEK